MDKSVDCVGKHIFFVKNLVRIDKRYLNVSQKLGNLKFDRVLQKQLKQLA